jgi:hypothetical protein
MEVMALVGWMTRVWAWTGMCWVLWLGPTQGLTAHQQLLLLQMGMVLQLLLLLLLLVLVVGQHQLQQQQQLLRWLASPAGCSTAHQPPREQRCTVLLLLLLLDMAQQQCQQQQEVVQVVGLVGFPSAVCLCPAGGQRCWPQHSAAHSSSSSKRTVEGHSSPVWITNSSGRQHQRLWVPTTTSSSSRRMKGYLI